MSDKEKVDVVGYHKEHGAKTFNLAPGEKLPAGYADAPHPGQHPHDAPASASGEGEGMEATKPAKRGRPPKEAKADDLDDGLDDK
jgi:hypothetical protein